jgi:Raf kinase inhibitor-like YbhB/YbcL family protein
MTLMLKGIAAVTVLSLFAGAAGAQSEIAAGQGGPPVLAKDLAPARLGARLFVSSPAFVSGGTLDERYTQKGDNISPPLEWARPPAGTQSIVVIVSDAEVSRPEPIVHWIVYNLPSTARRLPSQTPGDIALPGGATQGKNESGGGDYVGPRPPAGQTHPYHFQVFALNTTLHIDPADADRMAVINAMKGHVLASGSIVGTYTGQ